MAAILDKNAASWTAAQLLADVRQKARIPAGTLDYTDAVLLEEASRAIWSFAGWATSQAGDGRLLGILPRSTAAALNSPYAPGREIDLPVDAVGDTYDSLFWVDAAGIESRLEPIDLYSQPLYDSPTAQGTPWGYAVLDGRVRLYPRPNQAGTIRINYQRRLPSLVAYDSVSANVVTTSSTTATTLTFGGAGLMLLDVQSRVDLISLLYPYRYAVPNILLTGVVGPSFTSTSYNATTCPYPATNELQGWVIALRAGQSPFVHLPLEFKQCLTQKIAAQVLGEIGDMQGAGMLEQKAEQELARVIEMITPRSQTARIKVRNPFSLMRASRRGIW